MNQEMAREPGKGKRNYKAIVTSVVELISKLICTLLYEGTSDYNFKPSWPRKD